MEETVTPLVATCVLSLSYVTNLPCRVVPARARYSILHIIMVLGLL